MRLALLSLITAATLGMSVTSAQAARYGAVYGSSEEFHFVADTAVDLGQGPLALCHLTKKSTAMFFIGMWRSSKGYALVTDGCNSDAYIPISAEEVAQGQASGKIPADVPLQPKMTLQQITSGFFGLILLGAFIGFALVQGVLRGKRRKARYAEMGGMSPQAMAIVDAMCHAARADGHVADEEILEIADAVEVMTGQEIDPADVLKIAEMANEKLSEGDFAAMVKGQSKKTLEVMMRGSLHVVVADGELNRAEKGYISGLAKAMKMSADTVQSLLVEVVAADQSTGQPT
ncbi:TerB family tellurite resistance protein [Alphaproteobacteria bacterium KMM 3653]|uniref:TerB family tellurite resistance protein n=1 Tax=Harenicola maris TaxID=2841044 RepID=A0AAP2CR14_9RHOB|nr:TerB family tellurite resistance protein [Harenicola maris]